MFGAKLHLMKQSPSHPPSVLCACEQRGKGFADVCHGMNRGNSEVMRECERVILIDGGGFLC